MMEDNYIDAVFISVVDHMTTNKWKWPSNWDMQRKIDFIEQGIIWAQEREYYEQCAILQNVRKEINN